MIVGGVTQMSPGRTCGLKGSSGPNARWKNATRRPVKSADASAARAITSRCPDLQHAQYTASWKAEDLPAVEAVIDVEPRIRTPQLPARARFSVTRSAAPSAAPRSRPSPPGESSGFTTSIRQRRHSAGGASPARNVETTREERATPSAASGRALCAHAPAALPPGPPLRGVAALLRARVGRPLVECVTSSAATLPAARTEFGEIRAARPGHASLLLRRSPLLALGSTARFFRASRSLVGALSRTRLARNARRELSRFAPSRRRGRSAELSLQGPRRSRTSDMTNEGFAEPCASRHALDRQQRGVRARDPHRRDLGGDRTRSTTLRETWQGINTGNDDRDVPSWCS